MTRRAVMFVGALLAASAGCKKKGGAAPGSADAAAAAAAVVGEVDAGAAASRAPQTIVLDEVEVRLHGAAEGALVSRELGRELARCLIDGQSLVALAEQVPPGREARPARLRVEVAAQPPARTERKVTVVMDAQLVWERGDDPAPSATVTGDATPAARVDTAILAVVDRLRDGVCADLGGRVRIWAADDLAPYLTGTDAAAAHWALVLIGHRGAATPGLVDAVVPHLRAEGPLRDAAITAAVALGDARAVPALTELTDLADKKALATIVEAVIAIGGDDARDYLSVMSSHRDPAIAQHAKEGLARLDRRAAAAH